MKVGFFTVFRKDPQHYVLAELMIRSVRQTMPGVEVVQFTDETSPAVLGVDTVKRLPGGAMLDLRLQHYASAEGDWLLLDTDTIVQRDVRVVFEDEFDVALTLRKAGDPLSAEMPFNTGVVFSRSPAFWTAVLETWRALPEDRRDWLSEQRCVAQVAAGGKWDIEQLGPVFNYTPEAGDSGADASILHYKGPRKVAMLQRGNGQPKPPQTVPVFIGFDPRQPIAYHVAAHSILSRASKPVSITPLKLSSLPIQRRGLTEFTFSRFLVPYLCGYQGYAIFVDSDVLCLGDIVDLLALAYLDKVQSGDASVWVVKNARKFEWPSVMVFDCSRAQALTVDYVERGEPFSFAWAERVGELPAEWNHLVGYDRVEKQPRLIHYTCGVPIWPETENCDFAREWRHERNVMLNSVTFAELMGPSVHVEHMKRAQA